MSIPTYFTRNVKSRTTTPRPTTPSPAQAAQDTTMEKLMAEITKMNATLLSVATDVSEIKATTAELVLKVNEIQERVTTAEQKITTMEDSVAQLTLDGSAQDNFLRQLWDRVDMLENRSRRNNVRVIGWGENLGDGELASCMQQILTEGLGIEWSEEFEIERIHRVPGFRRNPKPNQPPRIMMVRFLRSSARDKVLQAAREKKGIQSWKGCKLSIYPDMSKELAEKRKEFNNARKLLRDLDIKNTLAFPATLRFTWKGKHLRFTSYSSAEKYIKERCRGKAVNKSHVEDNNEAVATTGNGATSHHSDDDAEMDGEMHAEADGEQAVAEVNDEVDSLEDTGPDRHEELDIV